MKTLKEKVIKWFGELKSRWTWEGIKLFIINRQWYLVIGLSIILFFGSAFYFYRVNMNQIDTTEILDKPNTQEVSKDLSPAPAEETVLPIGDNKAEKDNIQKEEPIEIIIDSTPKENAVPLVEEPKVNPKDMIFPTIGKVHRPFAIDYLIYSETLGQFGVHRGIDIKADIGTRVVAALPGTVVTVSQKDPRWGKMIIIDHGSGIQTMYASLHTVEVKEGQWVDQDAHIGTVGNTAPYELLEGPHLHFEVIINGEHVNPEDYIKGP
jgi:murein DD-endopeptidase MepM/ murein hydrolase activator NlpD